jgi:PHD/YefM family antitoxin component YafN of YafNO toxin-antitoxin module
MGMKTISTTEARKNMKTLVDLVRETGVVFAIGRRDNPEALLVKFPRDYNKELNEITNMNAYSESFSFLKEEPDMYSVDDLKKKYA